MFLKSIALGVTPLKSYRVVCVNTNDHGDSVSLALFLYAYEMGVYITVPLSSQS